MPFTYAIADLHGRYDLLSEAVTKIVYSKSDRPATIITLGGYYPYGGSYLKKAKRSFGNPYVNPYYGSYYAPRYWNYQSHYYW